MDRVVAVVAAAPVLVEDRYTLGDSCLLEGKPVVAVTVAVAVVVVAVGLVVGTAGLEVVVVPASVAAYTG